MSQTIDDFRNFFRVDKTKEHFSAKQAIEETVSIQEASLQKYDIALQISGDDFDIYGYKSEFQQVILNLITNAAYALKKSQAEDPKIDITLESRGKVSVSDNAEGIKKEILHRIFEPYFTTKEQGEGTGLGLYISKVIMEENMGATLMVDEQKGGGATFVIEFGNRSQ